jgi:hypothetical protein
MSCNVQRLPTYRSQEASEQRELPPERRYVQPANLSLLDPPALPAGQRAKRALRQLSSYALFHDPVA